MQKQSDIFSFTKDTDIVDVGGGLTRQMLGYNEELMAVRVWFEKGAEGYTHKHRHSQVTYIVEGEFHFTIDGETKVLKAGDSCLIPPYAEHGAICPTGGSLIDTFSPPREDFLED